MTLLQQTLFDFFVPAGLDILHPDKHDADADGNPDPTAEIDDVLLTVGADFIQYDLRIGDVYTLAAGEIDFDLGVPVLDLDVDASVLVELTWDFYFGFGFEGICCDGDRQMVMFNVLDYLDDPLIGIGDQGTGAVPTTLVLDDPRPNPFNPDVSIRYSVPAAGEVELRVVDVNGRLIDTLVDGFKTEGAHRASWDGRNANGRRMPSGVYFFRLEAEGAVRTVKGTLLR